MLGIDVPIFNGPMTPQAGGALARAVSDAGGFGMLGFSSDESEEAIRAQVELVRAGGNAQFGIGLVRWHLERRPELLDLALEMQPKLICISFGDVREFVGRARSRGILTAAQVQSRRRAQQAIDANVDIVIAQGTEAGGHTGAVGTLPLLQIVLEMTDLPVLAAGGIATGRGLAAVLAAGAAGAWIGTPFLLARESRTTEAARRAIEGSDETQTIRTSVYDRLQHTGWTPEFAGRALRNPFVERWNGREDELLRNEGAVTAYAKARSEGNYEIAQIYAGQSVGLLRDVRPAAHIVREIARDAERNLHAVAALLT
jgi:nitronate monooxygenase